LNNVAVTAAALAAAGERVLIADIDAHHGNGTQDVFWDDPRVLFVSWHQSPLYPGSGRAPDRGGPGAEGTTINLPMPPGATGEHYRRLVDEVVGPAIEAFGPTWILVSAGFDAHRDDPLTEMGLTSGDYADVLLDVLQLAEPGRVIAFLEGGYDLSALVRCSTATVGALLGERHHDEAPTSGGPGAGTVDRLWELHRRLI
jgi:acetoin utilization deacetylase AcuC-like enzyme